jgi:hypothetical protein
MSREKLGLCLSNIACGSDHSLDTHGTGREARHVVKYKSYELQFEVSSLLFRLHRSHKVPLALLLSSYGIGLE